MARIRTIKPEFWLDEDMSTVSPEACLLAIGLLNVADDEGYFNANDRLIASAIFPLRELSVSVVGMLSELSNIGYIELFFGVDGKKYGHIRKFTEHQVINRKTKSKIKDIEKLTDDSVSDHGKLTEDSSGKGKERKGKETIGRLSSDAPDGFEDFWNAYGKKKGKQNAIKEWKKIKPNTELVATIVSKASAYASTTDLQYRKDPERWIKGRHWEDDVSFGFGVDSFATHDKFAGAI